MSVHDWTRVSAGIFHHFHCSWITELGKALNGGILPSGYYALAEQEAFDVGPDVLTLKSPGTGGSEGRSIHQGGTAVKESPPKVHFTDTASEAVHYALKRRKLVIRHSSGDEIVALIEILSPGNKARNHALERFIDKALSALYHGYHLLIIDLLPPGPYDPQGIHGALWAEVKDAPFTLPAGKTLTLAAYAAGPATKAYIEPVAVGSSLPPMPLFLEEDRYVDAPLEETYLEAYRSLPERWRRVIEGRSA